MALENLLQLSADNKKIGVSEERLKKVMPAIRNYIAFWREYPDLFVDFLQTGGDVTAPKKFKFFAYQRVFLRAAMRYQYVYMVFPRGYKAREGLVTSLKNLSNCWEPHLGNQQPSSFLYCWKRRFND